MTREKGRTETTSKPFWIAQAALQLNPDDTLAKQALVRPSRSALSCIAHFKKRVWARALFDLTRSSEFMPAFPGVADFQIKRRLAYKI